MNSPERPTARSSSMPCCSPILPSREKGSGVKDRHGTSRLMEKLHYPVEVRESASGLSTVAVQIGLTNSFNGVDPLH